MRIIVKVGSALLSNAQGRLDKKSIERIASQLADLHKKNHEVILVSSGAIAAGVGRLGLSSKPTDLRMKQATAAIGQLALLKAYEECFNQFDIVPAQVLLTREDLMSRTRYLNARNTLLHLLKLKTIPIVNENDTVSTEEIQFGDNDTLAAVIATKVGADKLILLSNVPGLFKLDTKGRLTKEIVPLVERVDSDLQKSASKSTGSKLSVGGMASKLAAAKAAASAGIESWIASGAEEGILNRLLNKEHGAGTRFQPKAKKFISRHAWIAYGRTPKGFLLVDDGAVQAIVENRKSLLASGIKKIRGLFAVGDTIGIQNLKGEEIARGLVNFSSHDLAIVKGHHSRELPDLLGRPVPGEVVHRDNLVLI